MPKRTTFTYPVYLEFRDGHFEAIEELFDEMLAGRVPDDELTPMSRRQFVRYCTYRAQLILAELAEWRRKMLALPIEQGTAH